MSPFLASWLADPVTTGAEDLVRAYLAHACDGPGSSDEPPAHAPLDVLCGRRSRALISFTKLLFNHYFRHDLYRPDRKRDFLVLSSGSLHEPAFGLVPTLKHCIEIALTRDWYGYSDSRGRVNARTAVAQLENQRLGVEIYTEDSVAITLGGTFAVSCLADYLARTLPPGTAVCAIPNYPPLVESMARTMPVHLVQTSTSGDGHTSINAVSDAVTANTRIILLQSVTNPTGLPVSETALENLVASLGPQTYLILDEAHECFGATRMLSRLRAHPRVIRVTSLSKRLSIPGMKVGWILADRDLVDDFYEYASTIYGGPASFFYSLIDVYASFERALQSATDSCEHESLLGVAERYDMSPNAAHRWYGEYCSQQGEHTGRLLAQRHYVQDALGAAGFVVTNPRYSVNCTIAVDDSSYGFFRRALDGVGVSVYPNILAFDLADRSVRVTLGRDAADMKAALARLGQLGGTIQP